MELPVIELTIDDLDLDRVEAIAFVDTPAIQVNWMAFKEDEAKHRFDVQDEEKRIVAGALMIPDMNIYRNMEGKEFFVKFSVKTIEQIVNKFMKEGKVAAFNFMHDDKTPIADVYIQQSFLINSAQGVNAPKGFEHLPDGTWFGYIKVDNDDIWTNYVKTGKLNGFSVEGTFSEKAKFSTNIMNKIEELFDKLSKKLEKFNDIPAASVAPIEEATDMAEAELGSATLADGTVIKYEGELVEGTAVTLEDGSPAPDGEHTFEDGTVIAVSGGIIAAVKAPEAAPVVDEEMQSAIDALKLENEELKNQLSGLATTEQMNSALNEVKETQAQMFEVMKAISEAKDVATKKDTFKHAEIKLNGKLAAMTERLKSEGVLQN
jgi:hypothetical protein